MRPGTGCQPAPLVGHANLWVLKPHALGNSAGGQLIGTHLRRHGDNRRRHILAPFGKGGTTGFPCRRNQSGHGWASAHRWHAYIA